MSLESQFWEPWTKEIRTWQDFELALNDLYSRRIAGGRLFAWRGVVNADWALHSSLYRKWLLTSSAAAAPDEPGLRDQEKRILVNVHRWGLHAASRRLSILEQLATLQHFGSPTRLLDITFNAYVGLWFAVERKYDNGDPAYEDTDGRLFAVDVTDRLINEIEDRRSWEDDGRTPWRDLRTRQWCTGVLAWRPARFEARIAAQQGGFLMGGVPAAVAPEGQAGAVQWPKTPDPADGKWSIDEVRRCTSVAIRMHLVDPRAGGVPAGRQAAYTFRIAATAKAEIRRRLENLFGYTHSTIYPDYPGFAAFGSPYLRSS